MKLLYWRIAGLISVGIDKASKANKIKEGDIVKQFAAFSPVILHFPPVEHKTDIFVNDEMGIKKIKGFSVFFYMHMYMHAHAHKYTPPTTPGVKLLCD